MPFAIIAELALGLLVAATATLGAQSIDFPRYHPLLLDGARYHLTAKAQIDLQSGKQRTRETSGRDGIVVLKATKEDSLIDLEAWFDTLDVWREGSGERIAPETDGLIGGRYKGRLTPSGG